MKNLVIKYKVVYEKLQMSSWYVFIDHLHNKLC